MAELALSQETTLALRAQAHGLDPVVLLGAAGLSEAALREIDRALSAHGLVKVRAGKLERAARDTLFAAMAERLDAARVQVIGHTFVLFRPIPAEPVRAHRAKAQAQATAAGARPAGKTRAAADKPVRGQRTDAPRAREPAKAGSRPPARPGAPRGARTASAAPRRATPRRTR